MILSFHVIIDHIDVHHDNIKYCLILFVLFYLCSSKGRYKEKHNEDPLHFFDFDKRQAFLGLLPNNVPFGE